MEGFAGLYRKLLHKITLGGGSQSTLSNYGRCIAKLSLHYGCTPEHLSEVQINEYLLFLRDNQGMSKSYFKHTVYGLRLMFRLIGQHERVVKLPSIKRVNQLPVVLSRAECRRLLLAPKWLKHRVVLALAYSAGLRISEIRRLEWSDIDFDRKCIHIRQSKYGKDRMLPLSDMIARGLIKYRQACQPVKWIFNGRSSDMPLSLRALQWIIRSAVQAAGIEKNISMHSLRHSYATHLLEQGVDIITVKNLLGHARVETTLVYLHVAKIKATEAHSPLDRLYTSN